jgi:hypothetical protein
MACYVYKEQREKDLLNYKDILIWQVYAFVSTALIYFVTTYSQFLITSPEGKEIDVWA